MFLIEIYISGFDPRVFELAPVQAGTHKFLLRPFANSGPVLDLRLILVTAPAPTFRLILAPTPTNKAGASWLRATKNLVTS